MDPNIEHESYPETPQEVVERFKAFTKLPGGKEKAGQPIWDGEISKLYGDPEMGRFPDDKAFLGVEGTDQRLVIAYADGGLSAMQAEWFSMVVQHGIFSKVDGNARRDNFKKIIQFK